MPYAQKMGSKEKSTPGNFSEKDSKLISKSTQSKLSRGEIKNFIQSQAPKKPEVVGSSGGLSAIGGVVGAGVKAAGKVFSAFSNASKQLKQAATKKVPIIGKPGKTTAVPKSSTTKQVSYANPRISMTKAQRDKAGY